MAWFARTASASVLLAAGAKGGGHRREWMGGGGGLLQALEVRRLLGRRLTAGGAGLAGEAVVSAVTSNSLERGVPRR